MDFASNIGLFRLARYAFSNFFRRPRFASRPEDLAKDCDHFFISGVGDLCTATPIMPQYYRSPYAAIRYNVAPWVRGHPEGDL
jgi:hypothetical protein